MLSSSYLGKGSIKLTKFCFSSVRKNLNLFLKMNPVEMSHHLVVDRSCHKFCTLFNAVGHLILMSSFLDAEISPPLLILLYC